jgi:toxin ParE1/3/4
MPRIEFAAEVVDDFDRIAAHLAKFDVHDSEARVQDIIAAIDVLERNPLIGRPTADANRELVIGRGSRGYVALYRYLPDIDVVFVLAIRNQREAGYSRP